MKQRLECQGAVERAASNAAAAFEHIGPVPPGKLPTLNITSGTVVVRAEIVLTVILDHIIASRGESELDSDKLPELLQLKYGAPADAVRALGSVAEIRTTFRGFHTGLYED